MGKDSQLQKLTKYINRYYSSINADSSLKQIWEKSLSTFYSSTIYYRNKKHVNKEGSTRRLESNRLLNLKTNHFANLLRNTVSIVTNQSPKISVYSTRGGKKTELEDFQEKMKVMQEKFNIDHRVKDSILYHLLFGFSFVICENDRVYTEENSEGELIDEEFILKVKTPLDVVFDYDNPNPSWYLVRDFVDKEIVKELYPKVDKEGQLSDIHGKDTIQELLGQSTEIVKMIDKVEVWTYYKNKCKEYPKGRRIKFISNYELESGDLNGRGVISVIHEKRPNTSIGTTQTFDLLQLQDSIDSIYSRELNNIAMHGVNSIVADKKANLSLTNLGSSSQIYTVNNLDRNPVQVLSTYVPNGFANQFAKEKVQDMEKLSGVSASSRGETKGQSGKSLALTISQSQQFTGGLKSVFLSIYKQIGQRYLEMLKSNSMMEYRFENFDINDDYTIELSQGIKLTQQGREHVANSLYDRKLLTDPSVYIDLIKTGDDSRIVKTKETKLREAIDKNIEDIKKGYDDDIKVIQDHSLYIKSMAVEISCLETKHDEENILRLTRFIGERSASWYQYSIVDDYKNLFAVLGIPLHPQALFEEQQQMSQQGNNNLQQPNLEQPNLQQPNNIGQTERNNISGEQNNLLGDNNNDEGLVTNSRGRTQLNGVELPVGLDGEAPVSLPPEQ